MFSITYKAIISLADQELHACETYGANTRVACQSGKKQLSLGELLMKRKQLGHKYAR